ncbi:dehydratase [Psychromicrobium lacuslunae]|uniref:Dehydratase n=1 Tax=Psychromicrobium lacuslunae TaxID=1618207 RepID=A0A0D4C2P2_9MICC|nr:dehydratase [Psychromicrobium lacuslunae]
MASVAEPRKIIELSEAPSLSKLYAKAASSTALGLVGLARRSSVFPNTEYRLSGLRADREKLRDFNRLMHGSDRDELPAGFAHIMVFPTSIALMAADDFPLPLVGAVHLANRVEQRRRVDPTESFSARVWAQNPAQHRAGTQVEIAAELSTERAGEVVWSSVSTYLARGVKLPGLSAVQTPEREKFSVPDANAQWALSSDIGRRYAALSGDVNPIHMSSLSARALGMKGAIAHGMYLASRALASAQPAGLEAFEWRAEFATPTFIPGLVSVRFEEIAEGVKYQGWNARNGKPNFFGSVSPR